MTTFILGFIIGLFTYPGYKIWRMLRSDGWDDSNVTNAIRLEAHSGIHPEDFGKMYYLKPNQLKVLKENGITNVFRPFWYISEDEFESVVDSRPFRQEK